MFGWLTIYKNGNVNNRAITTASPASFLEGRLLAHEEWGIAVQPLGRAVTKVVCPHGFVGRFERGRIAPVRRDGSAIAYTGDVVRIDGGEQFDGSWNGCGGVTVLVAG